MTGIGRDNHESPENTRSHSNRIQDNRNSIIALNERLFALEGKIAAHQDVFEDLINLLIEQDEFLLTFFMKNVDEKIRKIDEAKGKCQDSGCVSYLDAARDVFQNIKNEKSELFKERTTLYFL